MERAAALQQRAVTQCARGRLDLAERSLVRALQLVGEAPPEAAPALAVRVRALMTLANVEKERHGHDAGLARLHEAQTLAEGSGDRALGFAVESALALQHLRRGEHDPALEHFARAEAAVAAATRSEACILYLNRGNLMLQRLQLAAARRDLRRCLALAEQPDDDPRLPGWAFMARHNLGYVEFLAGNLPRALQMMDEAARAPAGASTAIAALDRARVLLEAGLSDAADRTLREAQQGFRRGRLHHELAEAELARAECAVLAGDLKAARTLAASARTRFQRRHDDRWRRVAELTLVAADLADGRPPSLLVGPASRLREEFAAEGLALQARTAGLIACAALTRLGRLDQARARLDELGAAQRTDPIGVRVQQRAVVASLLRASGQPRRAGRQVRSGLAELSRHQAQFGSLDLQTASAIHGRELVRLDLELALGDGSPEAVFDAIERGRAVSRRLTAVTPPSGESADLLGELRQLTEILKTIADDPAAREEVAAMRVRIGHLYERLSSISWRVVGGGGVDQPVTLPDVAAVVAAQGRSLVSLCTVAGQWSAVVLGRNRTEWLPLPGGGEILELARRAQVDVGVLAYRTLPAELRRTVEASLRHTVERLDRLLLAPLDLGDEPLALIPTGSTTTVPWGCLPSLRGRAVEVAPTATSWLAGAVAPDAAETLTVEAFSGPGLATAGREAADVARVWEPRAQNVRRRAPATRDSVGAALSDATVVHVAAHGSHIRQNPMFSSLELHDGPLFAYEIADRRVAPHVVLSACELGQSTTRVGDEALGLARVLLQLGAQCVVAGVSQVADDLAAEVMTDYHRRLARGEDSAAALAGATAAEPYLPFVCFGSAWRAVPSAPDGTTAPAAAGPQRAGSSPTLR